MAGAQEGGDFPGNLRLMIGHDSEEVHRLYINVGREAMEKAAAVLPEL